MNENMIIHERVGDMRNYYIYLVEEEFASHYFGRESKMYRLFQDYQWTSPSNDNIQLLEKQIIYITKPIPTMFIDKLLKTHLSSRKDYIRSGEVHKLEIRGNRSYGSLTVKERYLELHSSGSYEAETIFFEVLRKFDPCFLAMDFQAERYGWLNPIKERNFI